MSSSISGEEMKDLTTDSPSLKYAPLEQLFCNASSPDPTPSLNGSVVCGVSWDGVSCWPITPAGSTAHLPCFAELNGVQYDVSGNASRECLHNASWSSWSNYRSCTPLSLPEDEYLKVLWDMRDAVTVYYVGYSLSLVALTLALWIFLHFRDLRCLRNTIHANLMLTYFLLDVTWILTARLQSSQDTLSGRAACYLTVALTYLMGTNFFWMFVEGLYLFVLVVQTFSVDRIRLRTYAIVGWVLPALIVVTWASVKGCLGSTSDDRLAPQGCPWQRRDYYDYIFISPVILVLLVNIVFLLKIMWVLITKLKATKTLESEQYRKAAKALLVLIPLLGVTYILVLATPPHRTGEVVFTFLQASLLSVQGFIVAVLYCFLNGEVQNSLRHQVVRWKTRRSVGRGQHPQSRNSSQGDKFYRNQGNRDSCISFTTSTSLVHLQSGRSPTVPAIHCDDQVTTPLKDDVV